MGAATGLSVLAAAWAATAVTVRAAPPGGTSPGLGVFLKREAGARGQL